VPTETPAAKLIEYPETRCALRTIHIMMCSPTSPLLLPQTQNHTRQRWRQVGIVRFVMETCMPRPGAVMAQHNLDTIRSLAPTTSAPLPCVLRARTPPLLARVHVSTGSNRGHVPLGQAGTRPCIRCYRRTDDTRLSRAARPRGIRRRSSKHRNLFPPSLPPSPRL
jgi:hypothetical protein